jgi:predicted nucleic acid-binding protein
LTLLIDTGPLVALADLRAPLRDAILDVLRGETGALVIPGPATAEVDYLLGKYYGDAARRAFVADLAAARFAVACLERQEYSMINELEARYEGLQLGLVDCALLALADRFATNRLLTFDERHFRAVSPIQGGAFIILPADA